MKVFERLNHITLVVGLLAAALLAPGCGGHQPRKDSMNTLGATPGAASIAPGASGAALERDVFREGDSVTVQFADLPAATAPFEVKIKDDGTITLLLNQTFTFVGKSPGDLEKEIRDRYVPRFYKYMTVTVKRVPQTLFYYVDGEVKSPARQTYIERTTVLKALASAGGFTDFAKKKAVKLTRLDGRKYTINCVKAIEDPTLDLEIYPGDKIYVPRKLW